MTKEEIKQELDNKGITYSAGMNKGELEVLLAKEDTGEIDLDQATNIPEYKEEVADGDDDFVIDDPEVLKPKELPLVINPPKGKEWANEAQAEYARTLNAYAYKNPEKWQEKKGELLDKLRLLADKPQEISRITGSLGKDRRVEYENRAINS